MKNRKVTTPDIEKMRRTSAQLHKQLQSISETAKSRIYVKCLKAGYVIKSLESQHTEMLESYTEDKVEAFVGKMLNSSAPVSAYSSIAKAAPRPSDSRTPRLDAHTSLGFTLYKRYCTCKKSEDRDYCLFRKLSYWENRIIQKELKAKGVL